MYKEEGGNSNNTQASKNTKHPIQSKNQFEPNQGNSENDDNNDNNNNDKGTQQSSP